MIDDPAHFFQLPGHVPISITTKLLSQGMLDVFYHDSIFNEFTITVYTMRAGFYSLACQRSFIIKAARLQAGPG
jgi:hypothetical protein